MPSVSVIIPAYNSGSYVGEAIESVLNQTLDDFEIVVVDDGSTDNTSSTITRYSKTRYFRQGNQGPSAARNTGIAESQGKYIAFLDADDLLLENSLQLRFDFLEKHVDVDLVFSDLLRCYAIDREPELHLKENNFIPKFADAIVSREGNEYVFGTAFTEMALRHHPFIKMPTVMVRRAAINRHKGFDDNLRIAEDVDLWLKIAESGRLGFIDAPLAVWNNFRSAMTANNIVLLEETIKYYTSLASRFQANDSSKKHSLIRKKLSLLYFRLGYSLYSQKGRKRESIARYLQSFWYSPSSVRIVLFILAAAVPEPLLRCAKNWLGSTRTANP